MATWRVAGFADDISVGDNKLPQISLLNNVEFMGSPYWSKDRGAKVLRKIWKMALIEIDST